MDAEGDKMFTVREREVGDCTTPPLSLLGGHSTSFVAQSDRSETVVSPSQPCGFFHKLSPRLELIWEPLHVWKVLLRVVEENVVLYFAVYLLASPAKAGHILQIQEFPEKREDLRRETLHFLFF